MAADRLSVFPAFHKVSGRPCSSSATAPRPWRRCGCCSRPTRRSGWSPRAQRRSLPRSSPPTPRASRATPSGRRISTAPCSSSPQAASGSATPKVVAAARERKIPANAVDSPDLCDFYTPAIVNRAPVAVAITSTGAGPVLAQKLRARIEAMLPPHLGAAGAARRILPRRRRAGAAEGSAPAALLVAFFEGRVADAALAGRPDEARRLASRLLTGADGAEKRLRLAGRRRARRGRSPDAPRPAHPAGGRRHRA